MGRRSLLRLVLTACLVISNLIGAVIAFVLLRWVVPGADLRGREFFWITILVMPIYMLMALSVGIPVGIATALRRVDWTFKDDFEPTLIQRERALSVPSVLTRIQMAYWLGACTLLTVLCGAIDVRAILQVGITLLFAGTVVCAVNYYTSVFLLRATAVRALAGAPPSAGFVSQKLMHHTVFSWVLGTGLPVVGLMLIALFVYVRDIAWRGVEAVPDGGQTVLAISILSLGSVVLVFGLLLAVLGQLAVRSSIRRVRSAMRFVEDSHTRQLTRVEISERNEIGDLQVGFNTMAESLEERARIYDLFGKHVGSEVVKEAVKSGYSLTRQSCFVSVLFVDIIGSTSLTLERSPTEVVEILNDFFGVVAEAVSLHNGFINKFEGDAARVVFGVSGSSSSNHAAQALRCALALRARLRVELPACRVSIGVATGDAIAANIGTAQRHEYTIFGQPVAAAIELSTIAKSFPGGILASSGTIDAAENETAAQWHVLDLPEQPHGVSLGPTVAVPLAGSAG